MTSTNETKIFGYEWRDIERAQSGGRLGRLVDVSKPAIVVMNDDDSALFRQFGSIEALDAAGFYGVADRVRRAKAVKIAG